MEDNSLIINFELLKEININISEFLYISYLYFDKELEIPYGEIDTKKLEKKQYIKIIENEKIIILRQKSIELIENLYVNTEVSFGKKIQNINKSIRHINKDINSRIDEYRNKWKGLKPGSMGGKKSCKEKLTRWMKENPEYTFDDVLKAVDVYLSTEGANLRYLQRADYFIFKKDGKEESSRLSAFIDEIDEYDEQEWTSKLN